MPDTPQQPMRNLVEVIDRMVAVAPDLQAMLASIRSSSQYAAPEVQSYWWGQCAAVLNTHCMQHEKATELMAIFGGQQP